MTERARQRITRGRLTVALAFVAAISGLAGMTDAIGFMTLGTFVSFMSGNTTRAGVALVEGDLALALPMLAAIVAFVLGNGGGVLLAGRGGRALERVLSGVAVVIVCAAVLPGWPAGQVMLAAFAMGMLNAAVEQVAGLPIGLTYVTGALSRLGKGAARWIMGERQVNWTAQAVPWTGMFAGALTGAWLTLRLGAGAFWIAAAASALLAGVALLLPRRVARGLRRAGRR